MYFFYSVCYDYYSKSLAKKSDAIPMIRNFNFSLFRRFYSQKILFYNSINVIRSHFFSSPAITNPLSSLASMNIN